MFRKNLILLIICVILIIVIIFIFNNKKKNTIENINLQTNNESRVKYNDETEKYEIYRYDGEFLLETKEESTADFYLKHPDFDPIFPQLSDEDMFPTRIQENTNE